MAEQGPMVETGPTLKRDEIVRGGCESAESQAGRSGRSSFVQAARGRNSRLAPRTRTRHSRKAPVFTRTPSDGRSYAASPCGTGR